MPTYEYVCEACKHQMETFQSITAEALRKCPQCGKLRLKRLLGAGGGLIFKGSGFYITDYRSGDYKAKAEAESKSAGASSEAKSESKAESKSEPKGENKAEAKAEPKPAAPPASKPSGGKRKDSGKP